MRSFRDSRGRLVLAAGAVAAVGGWIVLRPTAGPPTVSGPSASHAPAAPASAPEPAAAVVPPAPVTAPRRAPGPLAALPNVAARTAAAALLAGAVDARAQGDLRATLELLRTAVERAPAVETHAALGALYLELGAAGAAETHLRAAAEGDPRTAERWIALANALALRPDPIAAADALEHARAAEPGLRVTRDAGGWLAREPTAPAS